MNKNKGSLSAKWLLLPALVCSSSVLASELVEYQPNAMAQAEALSNTESGFIEDAQESSNINMGYVGGNTRIGVGVDSELKLMLEGSHVISGSNESVTSVEGWAGVDPSADDEKDEETLKGAGVKLNHNWVKKDASGQAVKVQKVFGAYDQNEHKDKKITAGYGEETKSMFWSAHVSGVSGDDRDTGMKDKNGNTIFERAYDYGLGVRAGKFMEDQLMRVQGGLDLEFGKDYAENSDEDRPMQVTASGNLEKFFADSPHSIAANVALSKQMGGHEKEGDDESTDAKGGISYRYDFGGAGIYQANQKYKRVRVEIPGEIVKKPPRVERKMVKHTMELEGDTFFNRGQATLTGGAQQRLSAIVGRIRQNGHEGNIRISGNTCDIGSDESNYQLSVRRAQAVRQFFINQGFDPNVLLARGLGETNPKYPNVEGSRHRNRRVDLEYMTYETKYKDEVVEAGSETRGAPRVVWRKELVQTPPTWVAQALRNNIQHNRRISTYLTLGADEVKPNGPQEPNKLEARNDTYTLPNHQPVNLGVLANDHFPAGSKVVIVTQPSKGSVLPLSNGSITYTPNGNEYGIQDSFSYRIVDPSGKESSVATVTVHYPSNNGKITLKDDEYTIKLGDTVTKPLNILGNDIGDDLKIVEVSTPKYGTAAIQSGSKFINYTLRYGYCETHSFTYVVEDKNGNRSSATVKIVVTK